MTITRITAALLVGWTLLAHAQPGQAQSPKLTLGSANHRLSGSFGQIVGAAAVDGIGFVAVDVATARAHLIGLDGRMVGGVGRTGSGPGEFREPASVAGYGGDSVVVLDRALRRLTIVSATRTSLTAGRSTRLEAVPEAVCRLGDRLVALGYSARTRRPVHLLDGGGIRGEGWGTAFYPKGDAGAEAMINEVASPGQLACAPGGDYLIVAPALTGAVRRHERTGALRWETRFPDYTATAVRLVAGGGVLLGRQPGKTVHDRTIGAVLLGDQLLLVQTAGVSKKHPGPGFDYEYVVSRVLRVTDGVEVAQTRGLPVILAVSNGKALTGGFDGAESWLEVRALNITSVGR